MIQSLLDGAYALLDFATFPYSHIKAIESILFCYILFSLDRAVQVSKMYIA